MIPTGPQIREGRALAEMSQADLAAAAEVALGLVVRLEAGGGLPMVTKRDSDAVQATLEVAGIEIIPEIGSDVVRLQTGGV